MAQHQIDNRCKQKKVISTLSTIRTNTMMTNNTIPRNPNRGAPKVDPKDRQHHQQQHQSDTASVASTVKVSNVATPSPLPKFVSNDDGRSMATKSVRPSNIKSILDSRDDNYSNGHNGNIYKRKEEYQRDSMIASANATDDGAVECKGKKTVGRSCIQVYIKTYNSFRHLANKSRDFFTPCIGRVGVE